MVTDQEKFFAALGMRIRRLRERFGYSQEDMISYGFSARHWQQIEKGRPVTVKTLLRITVALNTSLSHLVHGLPRSIITEDCPMSAPISTSTNTRSLFTMEFRRIARLFRA